MRVQEFNIQDFITFPLLCLRAGPVSMTATVRCWATSSSAIATSVSTGWSSPGVTTRAPSVPLTSHVTGDLSSGLIIGCHHHCFRISTVYDELTSFCAPILPRCSGHQDCEAGHMCCRDTCCHKTYFDQWRQFRCELCP